MKLTTIKTTQPMARRLAVVLGSGLALLALAGALSAQPGPGGVTVTVDDVECLPIGASGLAWATVRNHEPDAEVRLYFRRFHDIAEDFYYVEMEPAGDGRYWGAFPKPEDRVPVAHELDEAYRRQVEEAYTTDGDFPWAAWWKAKEASEDRDPNDDLDDALIRERASVGKQEPRHWMMQMDEATFQRWLEELENEPAEYFAAVYDPEGNRLARSPTKVTDVRLDCVPELTPQQAGAANNLTAGETAAWQQGEQLFHWQCDGIVSRIDPLGVLRGDEFCRACVVAWWTRPGILVPAAAAVGTITTITLIDDSPPPPASPAEPGQ